MSIPTIVLNTDKNTSNISNDKITIRQSERGLVLTAVIKDKDGTNYDLSGKHVQFAENKDGQKIIVDENVQVDSTSGTIHYTLNSNVYSASGEAWFEIINSGNSVIDSTNNFNIVAIEDVQLNVSNDNYISSLNSLMAHIKYVSDTAQGQIDAVIKSLNNQINQAISNGQNDIANELSDARAKLQAIQDQENKLVSNWTTELNAQKQNFAALQSQWQAQSKAISDSYQAKINEINTQAQSQHDDIQAAADQQLKANQSANDAEIAKVESETKAKLDEVEKAKNDAIAEITSQRDAAINQANADFKTKIDAFQKDYDVWKSSALADFTKQLADIKTNISNDQSTLSDFDKKLDYTKQELANISMTVNDISYVTRAELDAWQTKIEETISAGYVELPMRNSQGQQLFDHDGKAILFKKPLIESDKTLSQQGKPADASATGQRLNNLDRGLEQLNQDLYQNFDTKQNAQDLKNGIIANADANKDQDNKINGLITKANEIESGVINNTRTIRILSHDGKGLATHVSATVTARTEYIKTDSTLSDYGAVANAGKVGEAIKQTFLILNASIARLVANYNSLQSNPVIINLNNKALALNDQISYNSLRSQREFVDFNNRLLALKKSVEITSAESQSDNLDALHEPGRYYLGNAKGYSDAILEVATLGNIQKVMQYIYSARNDPNRTERRIGTRNGDNSYSWSDWQSEY